MTENLLIAVICAVIVIVGANSIAKRTGVAGPLVLVAIGVAVSFIPAVSAISVPPEFILAGVLPPLLYSAAVSAPAIEFRRDFGAISGLSVVLVIFSSLVLGALFYWAIPGLGFPLSVALGAILSPTDAVATNIVRQLGAPRRIVTVLEGESLLNDATALVLLRTGIVAASAGFSFVTTLGTFAWSVVCAVVIGALAGLLALRFRSWISSPTANTALGLTVPFVAFIPTEALGGSGLVAAVVAGVVCGQGALRWLTPEQRVSDKLNWRTVEFLFEGAVFLIMGLELFGIVQNNLAANEGIFKGIGIAALAFLIIIAVRVVYVFPMLNIHAARVRRSVQKQIDAREQPREERQDSSPLLQGGRAALSEIPGVASVSARRRSPKRLGRMRADIDYFDSAPLTWRHNTVIVWAGMRGAVTLAAAQTLPRDTPQWDLLIFIAFLVAVSSLLLQGLTLPVLVRALGLRSSGGDTEHYAEIRHIDRALRDSAKSAVEQGTLLRADQSGFSDDVYARPMSRLVTSLESHPNDRPAEDLEFELALVSVMRNRLHEIGRSGRHSTHALRYVLDELDSYEISVKLHLESEK